VDLTVAGAALATLAAKQATTTIPIVTIAVSDPVGCTAELALPLVCLAPLAIPNPKAFVMKPNRSPVIRADSHRHLLIRRDGLPATVTGLPDTSTMSKFDQVISWQAALANPMSDELTTDVGVHSVRRECHSGLLARDKGYAL
jgi:hypothetical protein